MCMRFRRSHGLGGHVPCGKSYKVRHVLRRARKATRASKRQQRRARRATQRLRRTFSERAAKNLSTCSSKRALSLTEPSLRPRPRRRRPPATARKQAWRGVAVAPWRAGGAGRPRVVGRAWRRGGACGARRRGAPARRTLGAGRHHRQRRHACRGHQEPSCIRWSLRWPALDMGAAGGAARSCLLFLSSQQCPAFRLSLLLSLAVPRLLLRPLSLSCRVPQT